MQGEEYLRPFSLAVLPLRRKVGRGLLPLGVVTMRSLRSLMVLVVAVGLAAGCGSTAPPGASFTPSGSAATSTPGGGTTPAPSRSAPSDPGSRGVVPGRRRLRSRRGRHAADDPTGAGRGRLAERDRRRRPARGNRDPGGHRLTRDHQLRPPHRRSAAARAGPGRRAPPTPPAAAPGAVQAVRAPAPAQVPAGATVAAAPGFRRRCWRLRLRSGRRPRRSGRLRPRPRARDRRRLHRSRRRRFQPYRRRPGGIARWFAGRHQRCHVRGASPVSVVAASTTYGLREQGPMSQFR
jgi:hypothetical protein